jgi:hypothetical protein
LDVHDVLKAAGELERELRLALMRAKTAGGSQRGKVWRFNSAEVRTAARATARACRKGLEGKRA